MTVIRTAITLFFCLFTLSLTAQHEKNAGDSNSTVLRLAFIHGKTEGHFRYFYMATDNRSGLKDEFAHAVGGGLRYETAPFYNWQLGIGGFFIFNMGSSNLAEPDPATKQLNRYEIGLFDIEDPFNKHDIDRLEELYLKYRWKKTSFVLGKQLINTPFINLQDGRMRPTGVEGLWSYSNLGKTKLETGILWGISPRSTVNWYNIGESVGLYPQGVQENGTPADYKHHTHSRAVVLLGLTHKFSTQTHLQFWEMWADNLFNTLIIQADQSLSVGKEKNLYASVQSILQHGVGNGGNPDPYKRYIHTTNTALTLGTRLGWKNEEMDVSLNYNRITSQGRYLMPREWGRDPFFTFLPRERNEGFGDVNAWMIRFKNQFNKSGLQAQVGFGYYDLPDVHNTALNKYGLPSYTQLNVDIQYNFKGICKGAQAQLLYVYKGQQGNSYGNDKYVIHKVNISLFNVILNYSF